MTFESSSDRVDNILDDSHGEESIACLVDDSDGEPEVQPAGCLYQHRSNRLHDLQTGTPNLQTLREDSEAFSLHQHPTPTGRMIDVAPLTSSQSSRSATLGGTQTICQQRAHPVGPNALQDSADLQYSESVASKH